MDLVRNAESHYKVYYFEPKIGGILDFLPNLHGHTNLLRVFQILGRIDKLKDLGTGF